MGASTIDIMTASLEDQKVNQAKNMPIEIDVAELIVARVRFRSMLRIAWLRKLWKENGNENGRPANYHHTIDNILLNKDNAKAFLKWKEDQEELKQIKKELEHVEYLLLQDKESSFAKLRLQLGINEEETNLLQICLALTLNPDLARVFAYMQDHSARGYVTDALVRGVFEMEEKAILGSTSPLKIWDIIRSREVSNGEPKMYECDSHMVDRLLGKADIDTVLLGVAYVQKPKTPLPNWPVEDTINFISGTMDHNSRQAINISVSGFTGSGRKTFAATTSEQLNLPLMIVDIDRVADDQWNKVYVHAQRHAYLDTCAIAWIGTLGENKKWPRIIAPFQVQFSICEINEYKPLVEGLVDFRVELPAFSILERNQLWNQLVPQSAYWAPEKLQAIISRYQLTIGQLAEVARRPIISSEEAIKLLNKSSTHRFGKLAQYLECPFRWDDLVLKNKLKNYLSDFVFEATEREVLWESDTVLRLFPQGKGLMALFSGPPGTGKTMAAQVIAAELNLDLYRIDLSTIVSKYVGETSKNIERILSRAAQTNAVLLFDEADALFGKRTEVKDAHDRYANTDTNYLLQAIESYAGIAILATNKRANIDNGFLRRLRYVLVFHKPDKEERFQLWTNILKELTGESSFKKLEKDLLLLAELVNLTGAEIKFAVLSALFLSRKDKSEIRIEHLIEGLSRELLKEGRTLNNEVKRRLLK